MPVQKPVLSFPATMPALCLFCLVCLHPRGADGGYDDALAFGAASDFLNRGMYLEAQGVYQEIAEFSPQEEQRARALLYSGTVYGLFLDQYQAALDQYGEVISEYPASLSARAAAFNSGMVCYESGEFTRAHGFFKAYLDKYPDARRRNSAEIWSDSARARMAEKRARPRPSPALTVRDATMHVLIGDGVADVAIRAGSRVRLSDPVSGRRFTVAAGEARFSSAGSGLMIDGQPLDTARCQVDSESMAIRVNDRPYRGRLTVSSGTGGLRLINSLPLEEYLYGVVPKEMPASWPMEALKAQAVAARTYVYIRSKSRDKDYHVVATTASQVYGGYDAEEAASNAAVDRTRDQVLTHGGKLIVAYFHANSGGYTEDARHVWGADLPYLKGVPDGYSVNKPGGKWDLQLTTDDLRNRMERSGLRVGRILHLEPLGRSASGRALRIRVTGETGNYTLKSNAFRLRVGATRLKSALLAIVHDERGVRIAGKGYGHGVGMSQWGARQMAQGGSGYREILRYYYHDIEVAAISRSAGGPQ